MPGVSTRIMGGNALIAFRVVALGLLWPCHIAFELGLHALEITLPFRIERRFPGRVLFVNILQKLDTIARQRVAANEFGIVVLGHADTEFVALQLFEKVDRSAPADTGFG